MTEEMQMRLKLLLMPGVATLAVIAFIGYYLAQVGAYESLTGKVNQAMGEVHKYLSNPASVPTPEHLEKVQQYRTELQMLLSQWQYTYKSIADRGAPLQILEFKERLKTLENRYAQFKIQMIPGLGFQEFAGGRLPNVEELRVLSRQLTLVTQLIELLIENNVEAIPDIRRYPVETLTSTQSSKVLFEVYPVLLRFRIEHANLVGFMNSLLREPALLEIQELTVESNFKPGVETGPDSRLLNVTLLMKLTEFSE